MPLNRYTGLYFKASALFNDEALGSNRTYQSYKLAYRSYHTMTEPLLRGRSEIYRAGGETHKHASRLRSFQRQQRVLFLGRGSVLALAVCPTQRLFRFICATDDVGTK